MIVLLCAALMGGIATGTIVSLSLGILAGLLLAPLGGSALALGAGLLLAHVRRDMSHDQALDRDVMEQVAALRSLLEAAHGSKDGVPSPSASNRAA